ncbi:MAG: signal peptidase [Planctomycetes bacterium]|nr:signal peptidase [Planctomycetota bacterium]
MVQTDTGKAKGPKDNKNLLLIRYGRMGFFGWFTHNGVHVEKTRTRVVIKTKRGLELGDIVGPFCYKGGRFKDSCKQIEKYYEKRSKDYPLAEGGTFVRYAKPEDIMEAEHLEVSARDELKFAQKLAKDLELPMKMVDSEHLLGGERIVIYFLSETRVDFRDLVKTLAKEYQTRIELRQVGARDEARLIGDYESCGQQCCCKRFLKILAPVNMRMAKTQKATLDPSKISGHCGRLKCCLRYEDSTYRELKKTMPGKNAMVNTPSGTGKVIDCQILTQLVSVVFADGKREAFPVSEIEVLTGEAAELAAAVKPAEARKARAAKGMPVDGVDEMGYEKAADAEGAAEGDGPPKKKRKRRRRRKKKPAGESGKTD